MLSYDTKLRKKTTIKVYNNHQSFKEKTGMFLKNIWMKIFLADTRSKWCPRSQWGTSVAPINIYVLWFSERHNSKLMSEFFWRNIHRMVSSYAQYYSKWSLWIAYLVIKGYRRPIKIMVLTLSLAPEFLLFFIETYICSFRKQGQGHHK